MSTKIKCLSKDYKNNNCCKYAINDTNYCKLHQYMNDYTADMLTKLELCKGCKKMYYFGDKELKSCDSCRNRGKNNREIQKDHVIKCGKEGCNYKKSTENKYCGLHQLCIFEDETAALNLKTCYNYIRGCRTQLSLDYPYIKCEKCLEKDRNNDHNRRNNALHVDTGDSNHKVCSVCCITYPLSDFIGVKPDILTKTCKKCRDNNKIQDQKRDKLHRNELSRISEKKPKNNYKLYEKSAKERNIPFELSYDIFLFLIKQECHYCGEFEDNLQQNGIDRLDSSIGYNPDNCISCCKTCNYLKGSLDKNIFLCRIEHVLSYNKLISQYDIRHDNSFGNTIHVDYCNYKSYVKKRNISFHLTREEFNDIISNSCYICGKQNNEMHKNGIDRKDNTIGYVVSNCISCCGECNFMKKGHLLDDLFQKYIVIYNYQKLKNFIFEINENHKNNKSIVRCIIKPLNTVCNT